MSLPVSDANDLAGLLGDTHSVAGGTQSVEDLRTYLAALSANLQGYLRRGNSLNSVGARLSSGGGLFLLMFGSESEHQESAISGATWDLDAAARSLARKLQGEHLDERLDKFIRDVKSSDGKSAAMLVADNGMIFFRPPIDQQKSTYDVSAADALGIARSVA